MRVVITEAARADLIAIGEFIRPHHPARAFSFIQELLDCCEELIERAALYPLVPRYEKRGIRRRVHGDYLIFYRVAAERLEVLHILNGAQDYAALLFPNS